MENQTNPKKIFISNFVYSISIISSVSRGVLRERCIVALAFQLVFVFTTQIYTQKVR